MRQPGKQAALESKHAFSSKVFENPKWQGHVFPMFLSLTLCNEFWFTLRLDLKYQLSNCFVHLLEDLSAESVTDFLQASWLNVSLANACGIQIHQHCCITYTSVMIYVEELYHCCHFLGVWGIFLQYQHFCSSPFLIFPTTSGWCCL